MTAFARRLAATTVAAFALAAAALAQTPDPAPGKWGQKAPLLEPNSEFTLASSGGKIYVLGGYPTTRESVRTVQIYDIAGDRKSTRLNSSHMSESRMPSSA